MSEATPYSARWVQEDSEVAELAALVVDPAREGLIVCVTTQPALEQPFVDPDLLAQRLAEKAQVWVITGSAHAWELTEALPPKIDVYGGAVRAWQPIPEGKDIYPSDHPQWTVFSADDGPRVIDQVVEYAALAENPPPEFGSQATATVTALRKAGAELSLPTGHAAFASNQHLVATGDVYHSREILNVGQEVEVRIGPWHPQAMRVSVSLRDFAPDPWERLDEQYRVGSVVEGVVAAIQPYGAFVELLPGAEGLLHKSKIADAFVEYIEDFVRPGDRIAVRLLSMDPYNRKAEVSLVDVPAGATPEPLASVYPGGPGWLPDSPDAFGEDEPAEGGKDDVSRAEGADADAPQSWDAAAEAEYASEGTKVAAAEIESLRTLVVELEARLEVAERERDALRAQVGGDAAVVVEADVPKAAEPEVEQLTLTDPEPVQSDAVVAPEADAAEPETVDLADAGALEVIESEMAEQALFDAPDIAEAIDADLAARADADAEAAAEAAKSAESDATSAEPDAESAPAEQS